MLLAVFLFASFIYFFAENLPPFSPRHSQNRALRRFLLLTQLTFAHKRALPQWKPIKENSCEHDFPSCGSHWLNY